MQFFTVYAIVAAVSVSSGLAAPIQSGSMEQEPNQLDRRGILPAINFSGLKSKLPFTKPSQPTNRASRPFVLRGRIAQTDAQKAFKEMNRAKAQQDAAIARHTAATDKLHRNAATASPERVGRMLNTVEQRQQQIEQAQQRFLAAERKHTAATAKVNENVHNVIMADRGNRRFV